MCLLTETRALSAQGEKRALVGNLTMPVTQVRRVVTNYTPILSEVLIRGMLSEGESTRTKVGARRCNHRAPKQKEGTHDAVPHRLKSYRSAWPRTPPGAAPPLVG